MPKKVSKIGQNMKKKLSIRVLYYIFYSSINSKGRSIEHFPADSFG